MTNEEKKQIIFEVLDEIAVFNHIENKTEKIQAYQTIKTSLTGFVFSEPYNKVDTYLNNCKILITSSKGNVKGKLKAIQINLENALTQLI